MPSDDARKPPQRYHRKIRMVATLLSGAFALPVLFGFGLGIRQIFQPPEPAIHTLPPTPPEP